MAPTAALLRVRAPMHVRTWNPSACDMLQRLDALTRLATAERQAVEADILCARFDTSQHVDVSCERPNQEQHGAERRQFLLV